MQLEDAKNMRGYLQKKSPSILQGYQKRYFMIIEDGKTLAYFEKQNDDTPKGNLALVNVYKVIAGQNKTDFDVKYGDKIFQLRADNEEIRQEWMTKLQILIENVKKDIDPIQSRLRVPSIINHKEIKKETLQTIRNTNEETIIQQQKVNEEQQNTNMIKQIGLNEYLDKIDQYLLSSRCITGFMNKEKDGIIKILQSRWLILISSRELIDSKDLDENQKNQKIELPGWMEQDVIYYFAEDSTKFKGFIKLNECLDVEIYDDVSEKQYGLKINMGDRLFALSSNFQNTRNKWVDAIRQAIRNYQATQNQNSGIIKKSLDKAIDKYKDDNQDSKQQNLIKHMNSVIKEIKKNHTSILDLNDIIALLDELSSQLLEILESCYVKKPPRIDIAEEYTKHFHEEILQVIVSFWNENQDVFDQQNLLKFAYWIFNFDSELCVFIQDQRLASTCQMLLKVYISKCIVDIEDQIKQVIEDEFKIQTDLTNEIYLNSPQKIFQIIKEKIDYSIGVFKDHLIFQHLATFSNRVIFSNTFIN